jgi:hypothetical protein
MARPSPEQVLVRLGIISSSSISGNLTINGGGTNHDPLNTAIRIIGNGIHSEVKLENATVYGPYFSVAVTGNESMKARHAYPAILK